MFRHRTARLSHVLLLRQLPEAAMTDRPLAVDSVGVDMEVAWVLEAAAAVVVVKSMSPTFVTTLPYF